MPTPNYFKNKLRSCQTGDVLVITQNGVSKTVEVLEREAKRGRGGYTRVTIRFDNEKRYTLTTGDFVRFEARHATDTEVRVYSRRIIENRLKAWEAAHRPIPEPPKPPANDDTEIFVKYIGAVPKTREEFRDARRKLAYALHPDRSGFDSQEIFLKAMAACDRHL